MQEREDSEFEIRDGWASIGDGVDRIADRHWKFSVVVNLPNFGGESRREGVGFEADGLRWVAARLRGARDLFCLLKSTCVQAVRESFEQKADVQTLEGRVNERRCGEWRSPRWVGVGEGERWEVVMVRYGGVGNEQPAWSQRRRQLQRERAAPASSSDTMDGWMGLGASLPSPR